MQVYDAYSSSIRVFDTEIPLSVKAAETSAEGSSIYVYDPKGKASFAVDAYVAEHHVVLNPLRELGYTSIGCAPCTRAVAAGEDPRAGRWSGQNKTECGLHT